MPRTAPNLHLALTLPESDLPLRHRVADALVSEIREGRLRPGDPLPSTRLLATHLEVSRGAVVAAYDELAAAGYLAARGGAGTRVAPEADRAARAGVTSHVRPTATPRRDASGPLPIPLRWDLRPGRPDPSLIDPIAWSRAWRAGARPTPVDNFSAGPPHARLRRALAEHLRRSRGIPVDPQELLVVPGVAATLHALTPALGLAGRIVALEDPGYAEAWTAFEVAGARPRPIPVDDDGLDPARLDGDVAAVYVTPAHQFPLGARMPVGRRADLLAWAARTGGVIIEDDYDGEFRYDVSPLPALRSLSGAAEHVVYVGTASKILSPGLRVAWLLPPAHLREPMRVTLEQLGLAVNEVTGAALAHFIESGALAAHHARAARTYAARRAAVVAALGRHLPHLPLLGVDAGLHLVVGLGDATDDAVDDLDLVGRLADAGVGAAPLSAYCTAYPRSGVLLCYACLPESQADAAVRAIAGVVGGIPCGHG